MRTVETSFDRSRHPNPQGFDRLHYRAQGFPRFHVCPDIYAFWPRGSEYLRALDSVQDSTGVRNRLPVQHDGRADRDTLKLNVKPTVLEKYMWSNGARLLKI